MYMKRAFVLGGLFVCVEEGVKQFRIFFPTSGNATFDET